MYADLLGGFEAMSVPLCIFALQRIFFFGLSFAIYVKSMKSSASLVSIALVALARAHSPNLCRHFFCRFWGSSRCVWCLS